MDYCYYLPVPYRPCQSKLFVTIHMFPFSQSIVLRLIRLVHANTRVMIMSLLVVLSFRSVSLPAKGSEKPTWPKKLLLRFGV